MMKEISSRTERFGAVVGSYHVIPDKVSLLKGAFWYLNPRYGRGAYGVCSGFQAKDHKNHFTWYDLRTP